MSHELNFRAVLRREIDAIPLPAETMWVPAARRRAVAPLFIVPLAAVVVMVVAFAGTLVRPIPAPGTVLASPPARPTIVDGRRVEPLPSAVRNAQYNYNLIVPAWLRRTTLPVGAEASAGLLYREVYSGRQEAPFAQISARDFLAWDLIVEVWRRGGASAAEWSAATLGCAPFGRSPQCALSDTQVGGTRALLVSIGTPARGKVYVIERGTELLVLRYSVGEESERPRDVTEELLDQVVRSVGLP